MSSEVSLSVRERAPARTQRDYQMARLLGRTTLIGIGIVAVAGIGVFAYQQRPIAVTLIKPEKQVAMRVFGLGTVEARVLSRIGFKVSGTLTELHADHGDRVAAGAVLARIDNREQSARLAKAQAQLESAQAALEVAGAAARKAEALLTQRTQTNKRRQELLTRQAISIEAAEEAQLNQRVAQADVFVTKSEIETAKAKIDDARAPLRYETAVLEQHELRAPFAGVVAQRAKEPGSVLAPGESLFTLVDPDTVWVLAYIDESRAGDIKVGQRAELRMRSLPQGRFEGRVARIGIESDRVNEERKVYVSCNTCPKTFFLGEQAEVFITTAVLDQALLVPEAAIAGFNGTAGTIWTVENGQLHQRQAKFGKRTLDGRVELIGDLSAGAGVSTAVSSRFSEGRSVTIREAPAP